MPAPRPKPRRHRPSMLVAKYTAAWALLAIIVSAGELIALGTLTPPAVVLDIIAVVQLPFGLLSLALAFNPLPAVEPPSAEDDSDGGGGSDRRPPDELPPSGGLTIDWERFEADFRAYAREGELIA